MKLVFDARALADLEGIFDWISLDSPAAAKNVLDRLFSSIELLITFPFMGHAVRDTGALEWVVPRLPYIVAYEVDPTNDRIVVTAVFHSARDRDGEE
jgi:toxin ParE1/3/4